MSDVTTCRTCGLPRFHGPAGYAGAQCLCQWKGATLPQMYDELMAKNAALEAENARLTAQLAAIQGGMGEVAGFDRNAAYAACPESGCDWGSFYVGWKAAAAQHERIVAALSAQLRDANNLADQWAEKNAALSSWQRTQSAPVSKAERPVPSGWAVKRSDASRHELYGFYDEYLGPLDGWLQDPRRAVLFGNKEAAIAVQAALSVESKLPISVVWLVYDPVFDTYREQAQ